MTLHPWTWWVWAIGAAGALSLTTNPVVVLLVLTAMLLVVLTRRTAAPWARSIKGYLLLAVTIVVIRVVFTVVVGGRRRGTVLFTLPEVPLPEWAAGIRLGGPVTLNAVLASSYDGLRLGGMIACVGAANALSNPRKALKTVPSALSEISVAIVIALALAPQLVESALRVRRAQRLRGRPARGLRVVNALVIPVIEDAVERSMQLAAGMESRGFGRTRDHRKVGRGALVLLLGGALLVVFGTFVLLGVPNALGRGVALLAIGFLAVVAGVKWSGRRLAVTQYRAAPWRWNDTVVAACGLAAAVVIGVAAHQMPDAFAPSTSPLVWPALPWPTLVALALLLSPLALCRVPADNPLLRPA